MWEGEGGSQGEHAQGTKGGKVTVRVSHRRALTRVERLSIHVFPLSTHMDKTHTTFKLDPGSQNVDSECITKHLKDTT